MTGDDFISLADTLLREPPNPSEAACRTAISRAYYGAFHLARAYLSGLGAKIGREHGDVWRCLGSSGVTVAKQVATKLAVLHENRTLADYDLNSAKPRNIVFAMDNVERATDIRNLLKSCGNDPERSQIKAGIDASRSK